MSLNLDKTTWTRVAFGDVIDSITDRVDNPAEAGVDRYVGLEHLDPGSMTVQRWDTPDKVEAQKLRFLTGDVIFGRRRAYQKKVALAEFEGICSAHALVLRARPGRIDPDFLPVFLSSDYFLDRAIAISVGSLSPTVNWRDLKVQEFDLPPLDEQQRIAGLLWAIERQTRAQSTVRGAVAAARQAWADGVVNALVARKSAPFAAIWARSPESGWSSSPVDETTGRYVLSLAALGPEGYRPGNLKNVPDTDRARAATLRGGDLLVSRANTVDAVGRAGIFTEEREDISFPDTMMRISLVDEVSPEFAAAVISSAHGRSHMRRSAAGSATSMVKINRTSLGRLAFPIATPESQRSFLVELERTSHAVSALDREVAALAVLRSSYLDEIFGGN